MAAEEEPTAAAQEEAMPAPEAPMEIVCENSYDGETLRLYQQAGLTGPLATLMGTGFIGGTQDAIEQINAGRRCLRGDAGIAAGGHAVRPGTGGAGL